MRRVNSEIASRRSGWYSGLTPRVKTRTNTPAGQLILRSLAELDAAVGQIVMNESPAVHWQDAEGGFRFDSLSEALEAMRDPFLMQFLPADQPKNSVIEEVREFPPYSTALLAAWNIVERLRDQPLRITRECEEWTAAFGEAAEMCGSSAALAICLAALRTKGFHVTLDLPD
jgi:hypothetical protein